MRRDGARQRGWRGRGAHSAGSNMPLSTRQGVGMGDAGPRMLCMKDSGLAGAAGAACTARPQASGRVPRTWMALLRPQAPDDAIVAPQSGLTMLNISKLDHHELFKWFHAEIGYALDSEPAHYGHIRSAARKLCIAPELLPLRAS